jgi:hypothetical protein
MLEKSLLGFEQWLQLNSGAGNRPALISAAKKIFPVIALVFDV